MGETNSISRRPVRGEMFIDGKGQQLLLRSEERKSTWVVGLICLPLLRTERSFVSIDGYKHFTPNGVKGRPNLAVAGGSSTYRLLSDSPSG